MDFGKFNFSPSSESPAEMSGKNHTVYTGPKKCRRSLQNHLQKLAGKTTNCSPSLIVTEFNEFMHNAT